MQLSFAFRPAPVVCAGALAAEEQLVAAVREHVDAARRDLGLLATPVRVVVPSGSLREHVAAILADRLGPHLLGVKVQTLLGTALEVIGSRPDPTPGAALLERVLALRNVRREPSLGQLLADFEGAEEALIHSVSELLEAGLRGEHVDAALDAIAEAGDLAPGERERAAAMVRAAAETEPVAGTLGLDTPIRLMELATRRLLDGAPLPARAVLVHGFADATGVVADLLEQLLRMPQARALVTVPPDPAQPGTVDASAVFGARLRERLKAGSEPGWWSPVPALAVFTAEGDDGEALEIARRIAELLDAGERPESIGVVAQQMEPRAASLRRHMTRLGIPFSGRDLVGPDAPSARWRWLAELLRLGPRAPTDRWLDLVGALRDPAEEPTIEDPTADLGDPDDPGAWGEVTLEGEPEGTADLEPTADVPPPWVGDPGEATADLEDPGFEDEDGEPDAPRGSGPRAKAPSLPPADRAAVRLGLRALGAARLGQAAALDANTILRGTDAMRLPGGSGLDGPRVARRRLPAALLRGALEAAKAVCTFWAELPERARLDAWGGHLRTLVVDLLGNPEDHPVLTALAPLGDLPLTVDREELRVVVTALLAPMGRVKVGGHGGGVQLLGGREARGRTFAHLFLPGHVRRPANPRDAVLTEPVRRALRAVLPDLPLRRDRFDEDRFHFSWLLSASPRITLSWQMVDERGKPASVSPLVERLRWAGRWETAPAARPLYPADPPTRSTALERAILGTLHGGGVEALAALGGPAVASVREPAAPLGLPLAVAHALAQIVAERGRRDASPSPWLGWLGTPGSEDPRRGRLFATALEDFVACPWQGVLTRFLDVGPVPDPLEEVPQADERLAGILVHRVLEAALREVLPARGGMVRDVARREPEVMPWPGEEVIARLSRREASRLLEEEGIRLPGLAELLAIRVEPYLDIARRTDWASGGPSVVGAEVEGWTEVAGRRIGFRADRADLVEGRLVLTDYKTGKPFADVKSPDLRRAKLRDRVAHGKSLQAVAYAQAQEVDAATGRYLFLGPGPADEVRSVQVRDFDEEVTAAFETTVKALLDALEAGALFPRLVEPDKDREPDRCRTCRVKEACVRGESGDRGRLSRFAATAEGPFAALWRLPGGK